MLFFDFLPTRCIITLHTMCYKPVASPLGNNLAINNFLLSPNSYYIKILFKLKNTKGSVLSLDEAKP
jgi:hypothetical protein